jgi:hypothetical protein
LAVAEHDLGTIETNSFDAETNLAVVRFGEREFVELKNFGAARFVEADAFYCCGIRHAAPEISYYLLLDGFGGRKMQDVDGVGLALSDY